MNMFTYVWDYYMSLRGLSRIAVPCVVLVVLWYIICYYDIILGIRKPKIKQPEIKQEEKKL
jgi:hypothetical protein